MRSEGGRSEGGRREWRGGKTAFGVDCTSFHDFSSDHIGKLNFSWQTFNFLSYFFTASGNFVTFLPNSMAFLWLSNEVDQKVFVFWEFREDSSSMEGFVGGHLKIIDHSHEAREESIKSKQAANRIIVSQPITITSMQLALFCWGTHIFSLFFESSIRISCDAFFL